VTGKFKNKIQEGEGESLRFWPSLPLRLEFDVGELEDTTTEQRRKGRVEKIFFPPQVTL
jgi:hypothetical protein